MNAAKRKISVSLDADLVAELEQARQSLSAQVNTALRLDLDRRRRQRLLDEMLNELDQQYGPPEEARIEHYMRLFE